MVKDLCVYIYEEYWPIVSFLLSLYSLCHLDFLFFRKACLKLLILIQMFGIIFQWKLLNLEIFFSEFVKETIQFLNSYGAIYIVNSCWLRCTTIGLFYLCCQLIFAAFFALFPYYHFDVCRDYRDITYFIHVIDSFSFFLIYCARGLSILSNLSKNQILLHWFSPWFLCFFTSLISACVYLLLSTCLEFIFALIFLVP